MDVVKVFFGLILAVLGFFLYFLPAIIADKRKAKSLAGIVLLNLFLGWTFLGWLGALIWAVVAEGDDNEGDLTASEKRIALAAAMAAKAGAAKDEPPSESKREPNAIERVDRDERGRIVIE